MLSFFMGMIAARAISEQKYNIPIFYHLSDKQRITYLTQKGNSAPDFFGLRYDKNSGKEIPYLFEAKGHAKKKYVDFYIVEKAKRQLNNIASVDVHGIGSTGTKSFHDKEFRKQIVTSSFDDINNQSYRQWMVCDIDPEEVTGNDCLEIDVDKETKAYYDQILSVMKRIAEKPMLTLDAFETETIERKSYILTEYNGEGFGIQKDIYEIIGASDRSGLTERLYLELFPVLKENKRINTDTYSIGRDGVIYIGRK